MHKSQALRYLGLGLQYLLQFCKFAISLGWLIVLIILQYDQYSDLTSINTVVPSSAQPTKANDDAIVTPIPSPADTPIEVPPVRVGPGPGQNQGGQVVHREERIEYRDAQGNILNDEQVKELKGKVKFEVGFSRVQ